MKSANPLIRRSYMWLISFLFVSVVFHLQTGLASEVPKTVDELTATIDSILNEYKIPGAGIAMTSKDSITWIRCFGTGNIETGAPITDTTNFRIASTSKSFIALGLLKLVDEGRLDLNSPVRELIPEIAIENPWEDTDPVRIVHLLEHTSGFDDLHLYEYYNVGGNPNIPLKQVLAINPNSRKVKWKPGTRMAYSSHGYAVARYIIEKISGMPFDDYIRQTIFEPIGMSNSIFGSDDEIRQSLAMGYDGDYEPVPNRPLNMKSMRSSTKDMALFVQFMLNRGKVGDNVVISDHLIDRMETTMTSTAANAGLKCGYGLGNRIRYHNGFKYYGHSGGLPGYTSIYAYNTDVGLGCVVLVNSSNTGGFWRIFRLVFSYLVRDLQPPPPPSAELSTMQLKKYTGYYQYRNTSHVLEAFADVLFGGTNIILENDTLYQKDFQSEKYPLIPVSTNTFRRRNEPEATIIFTPSESGKLLFADPRNYAEYEKTANWKPFVYRGLIIGAIVVMLSSVLYALVWIPVHIYKKLKQNRNRSKYLRMRVLPLLAILSLIFGILMLRTQSIASMIESGAYNIGTIAFSIGTVFFAAFSVLGVCFTILSFTKPVKRIARIYAVVLSSACFGITLFLWHWGFIGFRLWAY